MKIISIINQKGGVGKTTTTINLAAGLAKKGFKVLLIDIDSQSNATIGLGIDKNLIKIDSFMSLVSRETEIKTGIIKTEIKNLWILPSSINLIGADFYLKNLTNQDNDLIFVEQIEKLKSDYDFILIDCPPTLGVLLKNSLAVSDSILIPIQIEYFAFEDLTQLLSTISFIKRKYNKKLIIEGILITMHNDNLILNKEIETQVKKYFSEKVYKTKIPKNIKLVEASSSGKSIYDYDKNSLGSKKYLEFVEEFLENQPLVNN